MLTPFVLIFGRISRLPIEIMLGTTPIHKDFNNLKQYIKDLKERLTTAWAAVRENCYTQHLTNKHHYGQHTRPIILHPGDSVSIKRRYKRCT